jgi:hypothetical protein
MGKITNIMKKRRPAKYRFDRGYASKVEHMRLQKVPTTVMVSETIIPRVMVLVEKI